MLLSCPVRWCGSCPTHSVAVLASTAVMSHSVLCRVCGVWVVSVCLWCSCGGVSSVHSPLTLVVGGAIVDGGVPLWMVGWHGGGRAAVLLASLSCAWCPPSVCVVVLLNGGSGVLLCCPRALCCPCSLRSVPCLRIRSGTLHCVRFPLHCVPSCRAVRFFFVLLCCGVCGEREGGVCVVLSRVVVCISVVCV